MQSEKAKDIKANRNNKEMTITWDDGHKSIYPFVLLRAACPCALCRGGHENMKSEPTPDMFTLHMEDGPRIHLTNIVPTGAYGITLVWEDGHDYGIYNWHYLRRLCPCEECRG